MNIRHSSTLAMVLLMISLSALSFWPTDPAANLPIAIGPGDQVLPKIAATPEGGCYVGWYDAPTGYNVRLQRYDNLGNEAWAPGGILVSDHPQSSWITQWDMTADSNGNAVLVFNDIRSGGDWDIYAYKVAPDGSMLWGQDGVTLSDNADFEPSPKVTETSDGDFVFVWQRLPDAGNGTIRMQRLSADGTALLPSGGLDIAGEPGKSPGFCVICPGDAGSSIVAWLRDTNGYMADRHYRAEKFDAAGASLWGAPVDVYDETVLPIGYEPIIQSDASGGAILLWHRYYNGLYNSCVQHLDAAGTELFPHNGLPVSTSTSHYHISPTMAQSGGDLYVFWDERNTSQTQWGIYGQRFAADGTRLWGNSGQMFLPINSLYKSFLRALPASSGATLFWIEEPSGYGSDQIRGFAVDPDGNFTWPGDIIDVASTPSTKGRLPVVSMPSGAAFLAWEDDRNGSVDVYGQYVNADGSLGSLTAVESPAYAFDSPRNFPNPFNPSTKIRFHLEQSAAVKLAIYDPAGRLIRELLPATVLEEGEHVIDWNGFDDSGCRVAGGVYLLRMNSEEGQFTRKMVLAK
ncbi:MAG: FlgD immunoglobulin-like domain containing protein [Candidatus Krumholzibacteria bacterium]|jgi:hypothetical protein|nr:FlgD immunoglobulin-like domain containing protein [Candidatus Krumholzibacteria bacterium]MDP6668651.1 FlgD immunoglobulin-like domain containing protein [Candidatus Krumholzibacteria bacterium]MDP6796336.1 FlgD immunoglobulin-like domain containing protein [Candidatus Krumholzibacteria bacterium]MDP7021022.1 FlgD immunoglobulin-like domain containing protein [Candidatus Krumholzibacteria bacterium]